MEEESVKKFLADQESYDHLCKLQSYRKNIVPFVGAGMSVNYGFDAWKVFLQKQLDTLKNDQDIDVEKRNAAQTALHNNEYLKTATLIDELLNHNLTARIEEQYRPRKETAVAPAYVRWLNDIGCTTFLTTNYDSCIENADNWNKECMVLTPHSLFQAVTYDKQRRPLVIKLHGTYDIRDSIVLTEPQYKEKYKTRAVLKNIISYFGSSSVLVFWAVAYTKIILLRNSLL